LPSRRLLFPAAAAPTEGKDEKLAVELSFGVRLTPYKIEEEEVLQSSFKI
jgi:hypothetical protein